MARRISVVVVAADSGPVLRECVDAVLASDADVELVLVDNASSDGEPEACLRARGGDGRLRLLTNASNLGFGPACNRGAAFARGDALVFLNPDCVVERSTLSRLDATAAADPSVGLLGVMVHSPDGRIARGTRRRDPTLRRALMSATGLARFEHRWPGLAGVEMPPAGNDAPDIEPVDAVSGACLFVPRAVFDAVGGFDEAYFLHVEDLDLCRRVRDAGWRVALVRSLAVMHAQGSSSRRRPWFVARHKHRGMWRWFMRFDPAARNPLLRSLVRLGIDAHLAWCGARIAVGRAIGIRP